MRKEIIGNATLYHGSCLEIMPELSGYEVIITDPVWPNCPPDLIVGHDDPFGLFEAFCRLIPPDLRQLVVVMRNDSDPRFLRCIPESLRFQQAAWLQYVMPGYLGRVLGGNEVAYAYGEAVKSVKGRRCVPSVSPKAQPSDRPRNGHPCSRALSHQEWLVKWFSDEWETVCDPFMGSGTAGEAAIRRGRKFIGIEIEEKYFDIACRRLETAAKQPDQIDLIIEEGQE